MRFLTGLLAATAASLIGTSIAAPLPQTPVDPGNKDDIIITANNTINATRLDTNAPSEGGKLPMSLVNNFGGGAINAYVTGLDSENRLVMLQPDGQFFYPTASSGEEVPQIINGDVKIPLGGKGSTTKIIIPGYISSARVWFAEGELKFYTVWSTATNGPSLVTPAAVNPSDPSAAVNWGFVELTNNEAWGLYANISYVDFVGLILGMQMTETNGNTQSALGLQPDAVASICASLKAQTAKDGQPWADLCVTGLDGKPLRILAPSNYVASNPDAFKDYYNDYIDSVWSHYTSDALTVDTQAAAGKVDCKVVGSELTCAGDNRGYAKPTAADIFGCNSGPFSILEGDNDVHRAVVPRLCAAFVRTTLLSSPGGNVQPGLDSAHYYEADPTHWYSKFIHQELVDGRGYAFPYDDVNPGGDVDQSGVVASPQARELEVIVGGPVGS